MVSRSGTFRKREALRLTGRCGLVNSHASHLILSLNFNKSVVRRETNVRIFGYLAEPATERVQRAGKSSGKPISEQTLGNIPKGFSASRTITGRARRTLLSPPTWFHARRDFGRNRDHGRSGGAAIAGRSIGPREARRTQCTNNLKQAVLALHNFQTVRTVFPPSTVWDGIVSDKTNDLSAWARLLPFIEEEVLALNFTPTSNEDQTLPNGTPIQSIRIDTFICPSEPNDMMKYNSTGTPNAWPMSYGVNLGPWLVFDPTLKITPPGAFYPNSRLRPAHFTDGLSKTVMAAEIKMWTPYYSAAGAISATMPTTTPAICMLGGTPKMGPAVTSNTGHTEWGDGKCNQTGMTSTFPPNTQVSCSYNGAGYDVDFVNQSEGGSLTIPTYAAITSRSYHQGTVNAAMMDGSVQSITDGIDPGVWQALSTRAGREVAGLP